MRLSISQRAQVDLDGIWVYIARESRSTESADRILNAISESLSNLRRSPYIGRSRESDLQPGLRSLPSGSYMIYYRIKAGVVRIVRVIHGRRDINSMFSVQ